MSLPTSCRPKRLIGLSLLCLTLLLGVASAATQEAGHEQAASMLTPSVTISIAAVAQAASISSEPTAPLASETPTAAATVTPQPVSSPTATVPTPTATPPALGTAEASVAPPSMQARVAFNPVLAFMGSTTEDIYDEVALYDTADEKLTVVAQGIENEVFNAPLWSPQGDLLAFVQSDTAIGLYHPSDGVLEVLELAPANPPVDLESEVGVLLGGWSYDGDWLAYQHAYEEFDGESYLLNRHSGQSYPLNFPASLIWMEWSPRTTQIAGYTNESIYIANTSSTGDMPSVEVVAQYQRGSHYIRCIAWHPNKNGLLVSTSNMRVWSPLDYLWYLDLDSGEWTSMGRYPSIVAMAYSPDLTEITISATDYATHENWLIVIDAESFKTLTQVELPTGPLFFPIEWLAADSLALKANNNLYVLPLGEPEQAYWLLDPDDNPLLDVYPSVHINDWQ
jgi:hypothetical protein